MGRCTVRSHLCLPEDMSPDWWGLLARRLPTEQRGAVHRQGARLRVTGVAAGERRRLLSPPQNRRRLQTHRQGLMVAVDTCGNRTRLQRPSPGAQRSLLWVGWWGPGWHPRSAPSSGSPSPLSFPVPGWLAPPPSACTHPPPSSVAPTARRESVCLVEEVRGNNASLSCSDEFQTFRDFVISSHQQRPPQRCAGLSSPSSAGSDGSWSPASSSSVPPPCSAAAWHRPPRDSCRTCTDLHLQEKQMDTRKLK